MGKIKNILVIPDSFKESMTSTEVCEIIEKSINTECPNFNVITIPLADGGEGSLEVIAKNIKAQKIVINAKNALGSEIEAHYLLVERTAYIEMAKINGLEQIPVAKRNPLLASTFGTGQLIKDAIEKKATKIIVFIGGSATNDAGVGMAQALGIQFLDKNKNEIKFGAQYLIDIDSINNSNSVLHSNKIEIIVASDVKNFLLGTNGATATFSMQKGATQTMQVSLEKGLENVVQKVNAISKNNNHQREGAGAAGGLGYGLLTFANASIEKGFDVISAIVNLHDQMQWADLIITGEGSFDEQSFQGKVPFSVAQMAQQYAKPVIVVAGNVAVKKEVSNYGISAVFSIMQGVSSIEEALKKGKENLAKTIKNICKTLLMNP
jgi:glycerate 2-kinase